MPENTAQSCEFRAEVRKVLSILTNSLYTNREIFLRELISNASDAIDKLYFRSLTDDSVQLKHDDFHIDIKIDKEMTKAILINGIPSGIQNSIIGIANVVVQSNINAFGNLAMAGCGAYSKIEGFAFLPVTSFNLALTTFVGQNMGADLKERAKKGAIFGIVLSMVLAEAIGLLTVIFAPELIALFANDPEVIGFGVDRATIAGIFFFLCAFNKIIKPFYTFF